MRHLPAGLACVALVVTSSLLQAQGDYIEGKAKGIWSGHWVQTVEGTSFASLTELQEGGPTGTADLPKVMHWCSQHCTTLVWNIDHYTGEANPGDSIWTVESFTADAVVIHRTDLRPYPGKAVLSGKISGHGDTIVNGRIEWTYHPCCGLGSAKFNAAWGAAIETVPGSDQERARRLLAPVAGRDRRPGQDAVCASRRIRVAMQSVEDLALKDPNGAALSGLARVFTGIDARSDSATILASHNGSDGGRYTSRSPGSFVCVGVFVHGDLRHADPAELSRGGVHIDTTSWADGVATLSAEAAQQIMRMFPPFKEWFLVRPLQDGQYQLTLLPAVIELSREYSTKFTYSAQ